MNQYKVSRLSDGKKNDGLIKKNKKKTGQVLTAGRIILLTFLSLIFLFFLAINIFLYVYKPAPKPVDFLINHPDYIDEFPVATGEDGEEMPVHQDMSKNWNSDCYTFLILAMNDYEGTTDVMMLAMFNVKENKLSILNIPRDTYINMGNYKGLINGVYSKGRVNARNNGIPREDTPTEGLKYLCAIIKYTFGVDIQYYALMNIEGFTVLVDKVGGVDYDVPFRMKYTDPYQNLYIDLQPGLQPLNGDKAAQLLRFRHGDDGYPGYGRTINGVFYPSEDIGRIQTQQRFIAALMKKMLGKLSINTINGLFEVGANYMTTNISLADAGWFATKLSSVKLENIRTHTVPNQWISSIGKLEIYKEETMEIINKYYNPYKKDIPESNFNIYDKDLGSLPKPEINIDGETMNNLTH